jgi:hypothetical protein
MASIRIGHPPQRAAQVLVSVPPPCASLSARRRSDDARSRAPFLLSSFPLVLSHSFTLTITHLHSSHITSHHITSHHITSHHITSHHITSHHITPPKVAALAAEGAVVVARMFSPTVVRLFICFFIIRDLKRLLRSRLYTFLRLHSQLPHLARIGRVVVRYQGFTWSLLFLSFTHSFSSSLSITKTALDTHLIHVPPTFLSQYALSGGCDSPAMTDHERHDMAQSAASSSSSSSSTKKGVKKVRLGVNNEGKL